MPLTDAGVEAAARDFLSRQRMPSGVVSWQLFDAGSPDGQTAAVEMTAQAEVPFISEMLGDTVTIKVRSRSRSIIAP